MFDREELSRRAGEYEARERAERALLEETVKRFVRRARELEQLLEESQGEAARECERADEASSRAAAERTLADAASSRATAESERAEEALQKLSDERLRSEQLEEALIKLHARFNELAERERKADDRVVHLHVNVTAASNPGTAC